MRNSRPPLARRAARLAAGGLLLVTLAACGGGSDDEPKADTTKAADGGSVDLSDDLAEIPKECKKAFPMALDTPHLDEVELMPADWPEPPLDATLCVTEGNEDGSQQWAEYATDATPEEVIAAYQPALESYGAQRADNDTTLALGGTVGETAFVVSASEGFYRLIFMTE
ncbi:hypothetical protein GCM10009795_005390 [Nocardioides hankookensis]|uniref:DUF3558 domain-containing protein n=1 Tax=Nocardioides hankookensis TaxID=443157 RepID=A0ABW1LH84_9ACTN